MGGTLRWGDREQPQKGTSQVGRAILLNYNFNSNLADSSPNIQRLGTLGDAFPDREIDA